MKKDSGAPPHRQRLVRWRLLRFPQGFAPGKCASSCLQTWQRRGQDCPYCCRHVQASRPGSLPRRCCQGRLSGSWHCLVPQLYDPRYCAAQMADLLRLLARAPRLPTPLQQAVLRRPKPLFPVLEPRASSLSPSWPGSKG